MKVKILIIFALSLVATAIGLMLIVGMVAAAPPPTPVEIIDTGRAAWTALAAGKWVLGIGLALTLVIQLFKSPLLGSIVGRVPKRWRVAIPLALSGLASALLSLAGHIPPELALVLAPATAGVSIGAHELGESVRARRPGYRAGRTGLLSLVLIVGVGLGGCALAAPPTQIARGSFALSGDGSQLVYRAEAIDGEHLASWCRARQTNRWWSSALAQGLGVLAGGLAAAALVRDDDRVELGLEIGSLVSAAGAAGSQSYSSAQSQAFERSCAGWRP